MAEQYVDKYSGGRNLPQTGQLDQDLMDIATDLAGVQPDAATEADLGQTYGIMDGLIVSDPTTPSTQASGVGNTDWNVDVSAGVAVANSVEGAIAAAADFDVHSGSLLLADGESVLGWLVITEAAGTVAMEAVLGAAATTGTQVAPTDAEITTAVGHSDWQKHSQILLNRTGDTTVTQSQDNAGYRQPFVGTLQSGLTNELKTSSDTAAGYTLLTTLRS
jgi:hypothetical protein